MALIHLEMYIFSPESDRARNFNPFNLFPTLPEGLIKIIRCVFHSKLRFDWKNV